MATIAAQTGVELKLLISINEEEARALDAMAGYGDDAFVTAFYEKLGTAYMKHHEAGLRSFLSSVRNFMSGPLSRTDAARKAFNE